MSVMTSSEIRASFLDFFREKGHAIVPSSSLLPDSPNLLFTNAGMNQFVPIFLGQAPCLYKPPRAADTQKCIRAGGKHNDLEDVGFDTYHHTFFEMLGNWSFGDYFKKEAIAWAWELVVGRWNFPPSRIYATVYSPGPGDPASFDREAHDRWAEIFIEAGLDPSIHVVHGNKKDNFWMMGETGPCGPCSELHIDLTPGPRDLDRARQESGRTLVNQGDARCIEIWNLVFIQFNANPDGSFVELPAKHVDTGMGFERVTSMIQGTKGLTDFSEHARISNYETDVFQPLFDELEKITGKKYGHTLPATAQNLSEQEKVDVAFRVIADHVRTLSFSIADGIQPSNEGRGYVLRRILRRAVRYGRNLGLKEPFLGTLVFVLGTTMGHIFPEVVAKAEHIQKTLRQEEESFLRTLERGITLFDDFVSAQMEFSEAAKKIRENVFEAQNLLETLLGEDSLEVRKKAAVQISRLSHATLHLASTSIEGLPESFRILRSAPGNIEDFWTSVKGTVNDKTFIDSTLDELASLTSAIDELTAQWERKRFPGEVAFRLYDTYGFPLDLTELMARERGMTVDVGEFNRLMDDQKARGKAAQKKQIIRIGDLETEAVDATEFVGYEDYFGPVTAEIRGLNPNLNETSVAVNKTPFYAEMGGQVSDIGTLRFKEQEYQVVNVAKIANVFIHSIDRPLKDGAPYAELAGQEVSLRVNIPRRHKIEAHHSGTHLLHWALRKVLGDTVTQRGSYVGPDRLRFDFSHGAAVTPEEIAEIDRLINEQIEANVPVTWNERPYAEVKGDPSILQFFGDKYGDMVRVVSIGDFSRELCGGTHVRRSGDIGFFKILSESAIAAGVRRIEAASGAALIEYVHEQLPKQDEAHSALRQRKVDLVALSAYQGDVTPHELWRHWESREITLRHAAAHVAQHERDETRRRDAAFQKRAAEDVQKLIETRRAVGEIPFLAGSYIDTTAAYLPHLADALKARWRGVAVLVAIDGEKVGLLCSVASEYAKRAPAGKLIQAIAPLVGGKGGGRPELAQGGGNDPGGVALALSEAEAFVRRAA
jgi:alanyl-tRNA synthetase